MNTRQRSQTILEDSYQKLYNEIFQNTDVQQPELVISFEDSVNAFYNSETNQILMFIPSGYDKEIVNNYQILSSDISTINWPIWQVQMVEELIHAYQFLVIRGSISSEGERLHRIYGDVIEDRGHGADFFTALHEVLRLLNLDIDQWLEMEFPIMQR